jgi:hypothetical protein
MSAVVESLCSCGDDKARCQIIPGLCKWHALAREYFHTINTISIVEPNAEVVNKLANLLRATYRNGLNSSGDM